MSRVTANKLFFKDGLGGQKHFFFQTNLYRKSMKIIQNTLKIKE